MVIQRSRAEKSGFVSVEEFDVFERAGIPKRKTTPRQQLIAEIVDTLRMARKNAGHTQEEIAKLVGTSQSAIARLESHGSDRLPNITTILRYLGACNYALAAIPKSEAGGRSLSLSSGYLNPGKGFVSAKSGVVTTEQSESPTATTASAAIELKD